MAKKFFSYNQIHKIVESTVDICRDYNPDVIVAIGGGGYIPARMLRTALNVPILAVSLELYNDDTNTKNAEIVKKQWFDEAYGSGALVRGKRILVVDEVDDTRTTLSYTVRELQENHSPASVAVMVVHNKQKEKEAKLSDDVLYIAGSQIEDCWICYPWDAYSYGMTIEECDVEARANVN
tara:strand:+ start:161 stop:700 length:540 start_codon:yes stop_codon:yes gene_type:complete